MGGGVQVGKTCMGGLFIDGGKGEHANWGGYRRGVKVK